MGDETIKSYEYRNSGNANSAKAGNTLNSDNLNSYIPDCFGNLEIVFPMGSRGLRETPDNCMYLCAYKTPCLKKAMSGSKGIDVREEMLERGEKSGVIGFFERWSKKKSLDREKRQIYKN